MSGSARRERTRRFVDRWARLALVPFVLSLLALIVGTCNKSLLHSQSESLTEGEERESPPIKVSPTLLGGLRFEVDAQVPNNSAAAIQIAIRDEQGNTLVEFVKEAWAESGTWAEEGETGTWSEDDTQGTMDLVADKDEPLIVEIAVVDTTDSYGTENKFPVQVTLRVYEGVVDMRFLWIAAIASFALWLLAYFVAAHGGVPVIVELNPDSTVQGRATMGGPDRLIKIAIAGRVDETATPSVHVRIAVRDARGETVFDHKEYPTVKFRTDEGAIEDGKFHVTLYLVLPTRAGHGVFVEATNDSGNDHCLESLKLIVRDGATTRGEVEVFGVSA